MTAETKAEKKPKNKAKQSKIETWQSKIGHQEDLLIPGIHPLPLAFISIPQIAQNPAPLQQNTKALSSLALLKIPCLRFEKVILLAFSLAIIFRFNLLSALGLLPLHV